MHWIVIEPTRGAFSNPIFWKLDANLLGTGTCHFL